MDNDKPVPRQSILIVTRKEGDAVINVEVEHFDQPEAHQEAERMARSHIGDGVTVEVYRRMLTYQAEIKVNTKQDGPG